MKDHSFDAVIFDLDGVITRTASVHSAAWKQMFDEFLKARAKKTPVLSVAEGGEPFREFTHTDDYLPYVDGKPRYKGVASFLESRGIDLPYGDPTDSPDQETVCGLGNRKNQLFNEMIAQGNVEVFSTTVDFIKELQEKGIKVGVASSSKNAKAILDVAGLTDLFETRVDGIVSAELNLKGKPEADIFTTACDNLGVHYDRAVVVEDAVSGVQAGLNGNFGLVLGVAREDNELELKVNGADIVVKDVGEIDVDSIEEWFSKGLDEDLWSLSYYDYSKEKEGTRETLCTVGNGYFGTRGVLEESDASDTNYPGTYIAGVYNRLESEVAGRTVVNEDFVNCPNWLSITFKIGTSPPKCGGGEGGLGTSPPKLGGIEGGLGDGEWLDLNEAEIISCTRRLNFRDGVLHREVVVRDAAGRETLIESSRLASMAQPHLAALRYKITSLNYSGRIVIRSGLNGRIINAGVERYRQLSSKHLEPVAEGENDKTSYIVVQTNQSGIQIAEAAKLLVSVNDEPVDPEVVHSDVPGAVYSTFDLAAKKGSSICVDKVVAIYTSKESENPLEAAQKALHDIDSFDEVQQASAAAWADIWKKMDIRITGDRRGQKLLRFNQYHCLTTASPHNVHLDAGIPARGLHGEAYRGHIFWDELYILPFYNMHFPGTARAALLYRYRRLDRARAYAREHGYQGAMFPWQSGSDGREETPLLHLNPLSGEWGPDYSSLQRHVSLAIAYNIWHYFWISGDREFLETCGAEMFLEICRFWASKASYNEKMGRYEIDKVMGPDEYHEKYPGSEVGGLKDNSYTNIMVAWIFHRAFALLDSLEDTAREKLAEKINLTEGELERWGDISRKINIPLSDNGILEQFDGYFELKELDWEGYRDRYEDIGRMDRILRAEGKSPDSYKVAKQADALMTFYNLDSGEVKEILTGAGYSIEDDLLRANFDYYFKRTSHGSTLSRLVHSYLANLAGDRELGWQLYVDALKSDYVDVQGGTTKEGIHTGVMAGTAVLALRSYAGLNVNGEQVKIDPCLPAAWREVHFNIGFRGDRYYFVVTPASVEVKVDTIREETVDVFVRGHRITLTPQKWEAIELKRGGA
jgi:beta-phosphoglucomutase family hydrolase